MAKFIFCGKQTNEVVTYVGKSFFVEVIKMLLKSFYKQFTEIIDV